MNGRVSNGANGPLGVPNMAATIATIPAHRYPCAHFPCDARAIVVYQSPNYPHGIYGSCVDHLACASDSSRSVLEGARVIHFATQRCLTSSQL